MHVAQQLPIDRQPIVAVICT